MEILFGTIIIFVLIQPYLCLNNLTYVISYIPTSNVNSLLRSTGAILANTTYVNRLSSSTVDLLASTDTILTSNNVQSVVIEWNTGDCSYPSALAQKFPSKIISIPICFTQVSSYNNLLQLTVTSEKLGDAAIAFMNAYSIHYFSIILSDSNDFYSHLAQQFSSYLTQKAFIYERSIPLSNISSSLSSIYSLKSRG